MFISHILHWTDATVRHVSVCGSIIKHLFLRNILSIIVLTFLSMLDKIESHFIVNNPWSLLLTFYFNDVTIHVVVSCIDYVWALQLDSTVFHLRRYEFLSTSATWFFWISVISTKYNKDVYYASVSILFNGQPRDKSQILL